MALPQNFVSVSRRPPDIEDYIDMIRRYRSWIIGPMFAGLVISTVVAFLWTNTYQSRAVMRITPQQVSEKLVPAEFSTLMSQRLSAMEQDILSRTTLEGLITMPSLNLYKRERTDKPMEDIVLQMRHDINIEMIQTPGAVADPKSMASAFSITFKYPDRFIAQQVVRELVTKFTEQNFQFQRDNAKMTSTFLDDRLRTAKDTLDKLDEQIAKFQIANQGKLPEEFTSNTAMLQSAELSASGLASDLQRAMDMKSTFETQLQNAMNQLAYYQDNIEDVLPASQQSVQNQQLVAVSGQLMNARQSLAAARQTLGEKNYQVTSLRAQVEILQKQKDQLEKDEQVKDTNTRPDAPKKVTNKNSESAIVAVKAQIEATKTQIAEAEDNIKRVQGLQEKVAKNIAVYEQRIQAAPLNQRQWAALQRDHALAQAAYDDMVNKRQLAETSQSLEEHKAGENLEQLDAPSDPQQPIAPLRAQWIGIGTGLGLLLGVVLAGGKEMKNTSLKNLKDVRAYTNLPVLSSIPLLENALLVRRKRRIFWLSWTLAFVFGALAVLLSLWYYYFGQK
jgi:succinoglycan biosynthesis transport protein ExoP